MPKPLLLARRSGLYARFFVPSDLQGHVGSRYLVRPLYAPAGDGARLVAARLGLALLQAFDAMRKGIAVDLEELLRRVREGGLKELTLSDVVLPDGTRVGQAQIDSPEDAALFADMLRSARSEEPAEAVLARAERRRAQVKAGSERLAAAGAPRLSKAIADHLGDLERARLNQKTIIESRHTLRLFAGILVDDLHVNRLTQDHVRAFFDGVRWWPSNATKRKPYKDQSILTVIALAKANKEPEPAAYTLAKHRQRLSVFFVSLVNAGVLERSPLAGVRAVSTPDAEDTGEPFTDAQLQAIFDPVAFPGWAKKYPHRWFGPILGLYSGARVNEIAQLRVEDIDTIDGIPGFFVRSARAGQSIKNKNSRRFVPLAQSVLDAGFLTYVEEVKQAGHAQLFPNLPNSTGLGYGRQLSRQFSVYIKSCGITAKGQGFHGFRHTIASKLDEAGASASAIGALTGHGTGQTVLEKFYIDRRTLPDRVATIAKFVPPVALEKYAAHQFSEQLSLATRDAR